MLTTIWYDSQQLPLGFLPRTNTFAPGPQTKNCERQAHRRCDVVSVRYQPEDDEREQQHHLEVRALGTRKREGRSRDMGCIRAILRARTWDYLNFEKTPTRERGRRVNFLYLSTLRRQTIFFCPNNEFLCTLLDLCVTTNFTNDKGKNAYFRHSDAVLICDGTFECICRERKWSFQL